MKQTYYIKGLHCNGCVNLLTKVIGQTSGVSGVQIDLASARAVIDMQSDISFQELSNVVKATGPRYGLSLNDPNTFFAIAQKKIKTYLPLILILGGILTATIVHQTVKGFDLHDSMHDFMGGFFIIFGLLKVSNWKGFAESYRAYDPLAAKSKIYAYAYPLIELFLGTAYIFRFVEEPPINIATLVVLSIATFGIVNKLKKKELVQCACLGGFFNIPISWVTVFENALMIFMAVYMQVIFGKI